MSLRWRWAIALASVAALATAATISLALVITRDQLRDQVDDSLRARVDLASHAPMELPSEFPGQLGRRPGPAPVVDLDAVIQILDGSGEISFQFEGDPELPVSEDERDLALQEGTPILRDVWIEGVHYRMITAHIARSARIGARQPFAAFQIAIDISDIDQAVTSLVGRLSLIGLLAVVGAGALGYLLARSSVSPIEDLTRTAEQISVTEDLQTSLNTAAPGEVGRLATAFSRMLTSLRESREQQRRLVADASHEFRTPLTALRTTLETLERRWDDITEDQRNELLSAALDEVGDLSVIATELVDLATDAARTAEPPATVNLADLALRVAERYRTRTGRQIAVDHRNPVPVNVRVSQIERAIGNLVDNADKWSSPGEPIFITVDGARLTVGDRGPGVPTQDLPHIFERFYRSAEARGMPGSGLGLAIVEHVVTSHGGSVTARNHPDGGAEVGFTLAPTPN